MLDDVLHVGDTVIIKIPEENRGWGYNPCPDGTEAVVLSFSEIAYGRIRNFGFRPGVYVNRAWTNLAIQGKAESVSISSCFIDLKDNNEYKKRLTERPKDWREIKDKDFLRELPATPFWEGDQVLLDDNMKPYYAGKKLVTVVSINYTGLDNVFRPYTISDRLGSGWSQSFSEKELALSCRGNVWKFYHNKPMEFTDLREEAAFYTLIGQTEERPNPKDGLYCWTKEEVLEAIRSGYVHGFQVSGNFFGIGPSIVALRFKNEELGKRVAAATLDGFHA